MRPVNPLPLKSSAVTRPRASTLTPYHSPNAPSPPHLSERVQSSPPTASYNASRTALSESLQNPPTRVIPRRQLTKSVEPGTHRPSLEYADPDVSGWTSERNSRGMGPVRLLLRSSRYWRLATEPSSGGIDPVRVIVAELEDRQIGEGAQFRRDGPDQIVVV